MSLLPRPHPPEILRERFRYQGNKYTFVSQRLRFPGDKEGEREYVLHPGAAVAVPMTATGKFICIRQYRFAVGSYVLEFPAGTLEPGEKPLETMKRELEEETGLRGHHWDSLGSFYLAPGYSDEMLFIYLVRDLEVLPDPPAPDEDEDITVLELSAPELTELFCGGEEMDAKSIASFYRAQHFLARS